MQLDIRTLPRSLEAKAAIEEMMAGGRMVGKTAVVIDYERAR